MSSSPIYTSPYPPLPPIPSVNAHHLLLGRPEQNGWEDFALYVDPADGAASAEEEAKASTESGRATAKGSGTKKASGTDTTITFHAFRQRVAVASTVLARQLEEMGLDGRAEARPMVGILSENSVTFATAAHALLRLAIPFALLPAHATPYELGHSLRLTDAKVVLVGKGLEGRIEQAGVQGVQVLQMERANSPDAGGLPTLDGLIDAYLTQPAISPPPSAASLPPSAASLPPSALPPLLPPAPATPSTLAYLVLSSGTSGLPKAVMITHGNLIASLFQVVVVGQMVQAAMSGTQAAMAGTQAAMSGTKATLPPSPFYSASSGSYSASSGSDSATSSPAIPSPPPHATLLAFLPMYHSYGLHTHIFRNFLTPTTTVVMRKWEVGRGMRLVERYQITTLTLVPSVVHQLVTLTASGASSSSVGLHDVCNASSPPSPSTTPLTGVGIEDITRARGEDITHALSGVSIKRALSGVSSLMCGAAHLPADLRDRFLKTCAPHAVFSEGYGLSEASFAPIANLSPPSPTPSSSPRTTAMTSPAPSTPPALVNVDAALHLCTQTYTGPALKTLSAVGPPPDALAGTTNTPRGSVGKLMPGLRARIVRGEEEGVESGDGVDEGSAPLTGELYLAGPTIAAGYYNNAHATAETFIFEPSSGDTFVFEPSSGDTFVFEPSSGDTFVIEPSSGDTFVFEPSSGDSKEGGEKWLRTGDRFFVDREGWFFFSDRAKDTLKVSGAQVSPREIEEVLRAWRGEGVGGGEGEGLADGAPNALPPARTGLHDASSTSRVLDTATLSNNREPDLRVLNASTLFNNRKPNLRVLDVAVAGVRGHGRTADERVPRAWVVVAPQYLAEDTAAIIAALHTWTRARLSRHKWLRGGIEVVGEIPKNPTGKVLRRVLVERYERALEDGLKDRGKVKAKL